LTRVRNTHERRLRIFRTHFSLVYPTVPFRRMIR
jgi:hypothetical protein